MATRHEIPTHLNVEDRVLGGLTMPQLLVLLAGGCAGYAAWQAVTSLPTGLRLGIALVVQACAVAAALIRPHGQSLVLWALVYLRFLALPCVCLWRPDATPADADSGQGMLAAAPALAWTGQHAASPAGKAAAP